MSEDDAVVPVAQDPVVPAGPTIIRETDLLKAENANLRLLNAVNRETMAQLALTEATKLKMECMREVERMRVDIEGMYGINLRTHTINEKTGLVTPRQ